MWICECEFSEKFGILEKHVSWQSPDSWKIARATQKKKTKQIKTILAFMTCNPVCLISTTGARRMWPVSSGCFSSMAPDPTVAFLGGGCYLALDSTVAFWMMITFDTLLTWSKLFCIVTVFESGLQIFHRDED
jgi:hypothetical protein